MQAETLSLLKEIKQTGGRLWRDGDRLRYRFPKGCLTPKLLKQMKQHKADIIDIMKIVEQKKQNTDLPAKTTTDNNEPDPFVQLHLHSQMSTLDGIASVQEIIKRAKELKQSAVGLTNHGVMVDWYDFYKEAKKHSVKPIIGNEVYFTEDRTKKGKEQTVII